MSEEVTRRLAVTFNDGLPMGTHAHFKLDRELWIAYPASKNTRILAVIDRMIGVFSRIHTDMLRWINIWPDDAARVVQVLENVKRATQLSDELIIEKAEAATE